MKKCSFCFGSLLPLVVDDYYEHYSSLKCSLCSRESNIKQLNKPMKKKVSYKKVKRIKVLLSKGRSLKSIAVKFNLSEKFIKEIRDGRRHANIVIKTSGIQVILLGDAN